LEQVNINIFKLFLEISVNFHFRFQLSTSGKYVTAQLVHFEAGPVVEASTSEWAIKKQLYKTSDTSAYVNLAKVTFFSSNYNFSDFGFNGVF
jgi:hypothetical protein